MVVKDRRESNGWTRPTMEKKWIPFAFWKDEAETWSQRISLRVGTFLCCLPSVSSIYPCNQKERRREIAVFVKSFSFLCTKEGRGGLSGGDTRGRMEIRTKEDEGRKKKRKKKRRKKRRERCPRWNGQTADRRDTVRETNESESTLSMPLFLCGCNIRVMMEQPQAQRAVRYMLFFVCEAYRR